MLITFNTCAPSAYNLKYKLEKGKNYIYTSDFNSKLTQEVMGNEMKFDNNVHSILKFSVKDVAGSGDADIITSIDSAIVKNNMQGKDTTIIMKDFIGKKSEFIVSALGEMKSFTQIDTISTNNMMMSISQQLKRYFVKFAGKEIKIGETWTNTDIDTISAIGGAIIDTSNYVCTLAAKEIKLGRDCYKVPITADIKIKGKGNMQGMALLIEGTGKADGTMYIDQKSGVLVYAESNMDSDMTMAVSGQQNMVIPVTQSMKTTQSLISE
jgi:hypothetical protein